MEAVEMRERLSGIPASAGELRMCKRVVLSVFFATLSTNMDTSRKFAGYPHVPPTIRNAIEHWAFVPHLREGAAYKTNRAGSKNYARARFRFRPRECMVRRRVLMVIA